MARTLLIVSVAALASAWSCQALAFETVVGGKAGACSQAAKAGRSDGRAIDLCSEALAGETLSAHDRAGTYVNRGAMH